MSSMILAAMERDDPTEREELVAGLLQEIWLSALVAWITGVAPPSSVTEMLAAAAGLLLGGDRSPTDVVVV